MQICFLCIEIVTIKVSNIAESVSDEKLVKFLKDRGVETTGFRRNVKRGLVDAAASCDVVFIYLSAVNL